MDFPAKWLPKRAFAFLEKIKDHRFLVYGGLVRDYIRSQLGDETAPSEDEVTRESDVDVLFLHDNFDEAVDFLSRHTKALFPALIKERTIRVVVGDDESVDVAVVPTSIDLTRYPFDFTVNTFYCDGQTLVGDGSAPIYSPFKVSWQDVQQKVLRAPNPRWLVDYPFGAIRGLRLYCQLPFYRFEKATAGIYPKALQKARWDISPLLIVREFARAVDYSLRRFAEALYVTRGDEVFFDPLQKLLRGAESQHLFLTYSAFDDSLRTDKYGKRWAKFCAKAKEVLVNVRMGVSRYRNLLNMTGFALLLHDIGKAIKEDSHDILGARLVGKITEQLSFFPNERWIIYWLVRYHMRVHEAAHGDEKAIQWLKRKRDVLRYAAILLAASDALGHPESSSPEEVTTRFLDLASAVI